MKNLMLILLVTVFVSCKKDDLSPKNTKEFTIHSTSNGATYKMKIALPDNYNPTTQKYAAVYVLDGKQNFNYVSSQCEDISRDYSTSNVMVVSIGYGHDRAKDYTPTNTNEGDGGGEKFMLFIKNELLPKMENEYGADTTRKSRVILGHSFGGLLAAYAFTNFNEVFSNYIMLSPSLWYDNEILLRWEQDHRGENIFRKQLVFMGIGEMETGGIMQAPFEAFYNRLRNNYPLMKIGRHNEPLLDHNGSKNPNIKEGLKYYFQNR